MAARPPVDSANACRLGRLDGDQAQAASALSAAHARNIVHRDIKPDNLVLAENGTLKVLDFGIAKLVSDLSHGGQEPRRRRLTALNQVVGTFAYMSPEQFEPEVALDGRSDVYSLGVVLYRLLSVKPIWPTNNLHEIVKLLKTTKPVDIQKHVPDLPDHAAEVVRRALERDRTQRFQSMEEMQKALVSSGQRWGKDDDEAPTTRVYAPGADTIVDDPGPPPAAPAAPASISRRAASSRLRTVLIAACVVLAVATLAAWRVMGARKRVVPAAVEVSNHRADPIDAVSATGRSVAGKSTDVPVVATPRNP